MQPKVKYTLVPTGWGFFGLAAVGERVYRTVLPSPEPDIAADYLLQGLSSVEHEPELLRSVQMKVIDYFDAKPVDFSGFKVYLAEQSDFARKVLSFCHKKIKYGQTATYADLAKQAGSPRAVRAAGQIMAHNPMPLIIPCHRVVASDGKTGGFSAAGGIETKQKMLTLEGAEA